MTLRMLRMAYTVLGLSSPLAARLGVSPCLCRARHLEPNRACGHVPSQSEEPFGDDKVLILLAMPRGRFVIYGGRAGIVSWLLIRAV